MGSPIIVEGQLWGAVIALSGPSGTHPESTEERLRAFTELVAMAVANTESRAQLAASRARVVTAADETRRRIERDLHDGAQHRLISLALELRAAEAQVPPEQRGLTAQWSRTAQGLADVVEELREISRGLHPAILEKGGLGPALRALARRAAVPVELSVGVSGRLPPRVEAAAYYVVSEALTNAAKHATASVARVEIGVADETLRLLVRDDGTGGADPSRGSGLIGLSDRVEAVGGRFEVTSPPRRRHDAAGHHPGPAGRDGDRTRLNYQSGWSMSTAGRSCTSFLLRLSAIPSSIPVTAPIGMATSLRPHR